MFDWANRSTKATLIFIDEADAFFKDRNTTKEISESLRNSINAFLYRTGSPSKKFFFVIATNTP